MYIIFFKVGIFINFLLSSVCNSCKSNNLKYSINKYYFPSAIEKCQDNRAIILLSWWQLDIFSAHPPICCRVLSRMNSNTTTSLRFWSIERMREHIIELLVVLEHPCCCHYSEQLVIFRSAAPGQWSLTLRGFEFRHCFQIVIVWFKYERILWTRTISFKVRSSSAT